MLVVNRDKVWSNSSSETANLTERQGRKITGLQAHCNRRAQDSGITELDWILLFRCGNLA